MRPSNRKTAAFAEMHRTIHSIVVVDVPDQKLFDG